MDNRTLIATMENLPVGLMQALPNLNYRLDIPGLIAWISDVASHPYAIMVADIVAINLVI